MSRDYLPELENDFSAWLAYFAVAVERYQDQLDLDGLDVEAMYEANVTLHDSLAGVETAKSTLRQQTEAKDAARRNVTAAVRALARRIQANPAVTPALKAALGLTPRTKKTVLRSPRPPTQFAAEGFANGTIELRWNASGNAPETLYLVEAAYGSTANFVGITAVTATRCTLEGHSAAMPVTFRIRARRRHEVSAPSESVTLYAL